MSNYQTYKQKVEKFIKDHESSIDFVIKNEIPQHILWKKEATSAFSEKEPEAKCTKIKGEFYFTERMVNNLMYFAYLMGAKDIDFNSYQKGWNDREDSFRKALEES